MIVLVLGAAAIALAVAYELISQWIRQKKRLRSRGFEVKLSTDDSAKSEDDRQ